MAWRTYVDYVNQILIDGMVHAIAASMKYLKNQVDPAFLNQNDVNPLLEIQLRLAPPLVVYEPMMGSTGEYWQTCGQFSKRDPCRLDMPSTAGTSDN